MAYSVGIRTTARALRKRGYSLKEISSRFHVAKSTASLWVEDIALDAKAEKRLLGIIKRGQFISAKNRRAKTRVLEQRYFDEALEEIRSNPNHEKNVCAMIYWCEGAKDPKNGVVFTNSDPSLVKTFLKLLRTSFLLDENRFHPCIHLHSYHSPRKQLDFWAKITDINKRQFIKPYLKSNTGKRIRSGYQGCISVRYRDSDLARRLLAFARAYLNQMGA